MARILFGAQELDLWFNKAHIATLEEAGYDVLRISDAGRLLEAMVSGEGDLVILFGGPMPFGSLGHYEMQSGHYAGFSVVADARERGCGTPVLVLETFFPPRWARELSNIAFLWAPCSLDELSDKVEELLDGGGGDGRS